MADKRITDLSLISEFTDTCNMAVDDTVQTYRSTGAQLLSYVKQSNGLITTKTDSYTILDDDDARTVLVTTGASDRTITLPTAASPNVNRIITAKKLDTGAGKLILDGNGAQTIDGALTYSLDGVYDYVTVQSDGSNWHTIGELRSTKFQKKYLASDKQTDVTLSDLTFSNLIIGRTYRVFFNGQASQIGNSSNALSQVDITHNSGVIGRWQARTDSYQGNDVRRFCMGQTVTFVAAATTLTFEYLQSSTNDVLEGDGSARETYATLEELKNHLETTEW